METSCLYIIEEDDGYGNRTLRVFESECQMQKWYVAMTLDQIHYRIDEMGSEEAEEYEWTDAESEILEAPTLQSKMYVAMSWQELPFPYYTFRFHTAEKTIHCSHHSVTIEE